MNAVYESMTKIEYSWKQEICFYVIRIWRSEDKLQDKYDNTDIERALFQRFADVKPTRVELIDFILAQDRVSAVEVTDTYGNGAVAYKEWP